ncbi:glycosyl hydrolase [Streptomyces sp. Li-HN-5-11]|uniref:glycosyl hydrolase n=1 Tax=Streptomyces sp. Li-HN-5-11 TaxID=3075432 RepID=UPI0028B06932|nr:glycosyl hydrolase [Streptomyces sp. Li-HN-5-11]WNM36030.1 glycosyl hydrolase [Streptomyces sp. Li-HN-5-11]
MRRRKAIVGAILGAAIAAGTMLAPAADAAPAQPVTNPVMWGIEAGSVAQDTATGQYAGLAPAIDSWFLSQSASTASVTKMAAARQAGAVPMIAWSPEGNLTQIKNGQMDAQIISMAKSLAAYGHPFYFRPFAEFNTPWETYSLGKEGNTPQALYAAWRRVFRIFRQYTGSKSLFVWTVGYSGSITPLKTAWPGSDYVNYVGIDSYDWCTKPTWCPGDQYRYKTVLNALRAFDGGRPAVLAETATGLQTADKGKWLGAAFKTAQADHINALVWFDEIVPNTTQPDWRLASPPSAQAGIQAALRQPNIASPKYRSITTLETYAMTASWARAIR